MSVYFLLNHITIDNLSQGLIHQCFIQHICLVGKTVYPILKTMNWPEERLKGNLEHCQVSEEV